MRAAVSHRVILTVALSTMWTVSAGAALLCKKKSGVVVVREACKKMETPLDLAQFGVMPPTPPDTPDQVRAKFFAGTACPGNDPDDVMVRVGNLCVDVYEASVWSTPTGGTQYGIETLGYPCGPNGNDCTSIYARSVAGVKPSTSLTWFQAQQACRNAGKRLLTNAESQMAAAGTPDPGDGGNGTTTCNTNSSGPVNTGTSGDCVSRAGVRDMVGNFDEWVADWVSRPTACPGWATFSDDYSCLAGADATSPPRALIRGGYYYDGTHAGVFSVESFLDLSGSADFVGFRCAR